MGLSKLMGLLLDKISRKHVERLPELDISDEVGSNARRVEFIMERSSRRNYSELETGMVIQATAEVVAGGKCDVIIEEEFEYSEEGRIQRHKRKALVTKRNKLKSIFDAFQNRKTNLLPIAN